MNHPLARRRRTCPTALVIAAALALGCAPTRTDIRGTAPVEAPATPPESSAAEEAPAPGAEGTRPEPEPPGPAPDAPAAPSPEQAGRTALRERIVAAARALLGTRVRLDCSGYVLAAYRRAGLSFALPPARTRSESLRAVGQEVTTPEPGDLAFFHDTYDRSRNGRRDHGITHVALVEAVDGSSVTLLHRGLRKVERFRMDLERPWDRERNDPVRVRRPRDARGTRYLAGQLFTAFGALLDVAVTQSFQARPGPDTADRHSPKRWQSARARTSNSGPEPSR